MAVEKFFQFLEILFQRCKQVALMKGGCRVEEREDDEVLHVEGLCLHFGDTDFSFQEGLSGPVAQGADELRPNQLNLLHQERLACFHFVLLRVTVVRWPALDDVRNVDLVA